ncbi:MAG: hypothetical protein JWO13_3030 [Acidobacteriales bacterium]|nr:hypothetical protein [Terriglobales bacterium]
MGIGGKRKPETRHEAFGTEIGEGEDKVNPNDLLELMVRAEFPPAGEMTTGTAESADEDVNPQVKRKPIISINGKDVDERELERPANQPNKNAA